jgi:site-specific recombinase XerC
MHELRHSAADNFWRATGDLILAKELLRHQSVATAHEYLHADRSTPSRPSRRCKSCVPT